MKNIIIVSGAVISATVGYLVGKYAIMECQLHAKKRKEEKDKK